MRLFTGCTSRGCSPVSDCVTVLWNVFGSSTRINCFAIRRPSIRGCLSSRRATIASFISRRDVPTRSCCMEEMRQILHVSAATAQKIIDYRQQHGNYTSVDQLLQVVSRSIYDRIRKLVTV